MLRGTFDARSVAPLPNKTRGDPRVARYLHTAPKRLDTVGVVGFNPNRAYKDSAKLRSYPSLMHPTRPVRARRLPHRSLPNRRKRGPGSTLAVVEAGWGLQPRDGAHAPSSLGCAAGQAAPDAPGELGEASSSRTEGRRASFRGRAEERDHVARAGARYESPPIRDRLRRERRPRRHRPPSREAGRAPRSVRPCRGQSGTARC